MFRNILHAHEAHLKVRQRITSEVIHLLSTDTLCSAYCTQNEFLYLKLSKISMVSLQLSIIKTACD